MTAMFCSRCGAQLVPNAAFCSKCGSAIDTPAPPVAQASTQPRIFTQPPAPRGPVVIKRPGIVTVLAVLQFIGAAFWLLIGFGGMAASLGTPGTDAFGGTIAMGIFAACGVAQLFCGIGLLGLKPYGRTLQLIFAWIGLLGIPVGTVISVLILIYLFKPGIKLIFSGRPGDDFTDQELADITNDTRNSGATTAIVVIVGVLLLIVVVAIVAAISVPALLRARQSGNEAVAISSLRAIASAELTYAATCAQGGYAVSLEDLAKPPTSGGDAFISADLSRSGAEKSGYRFSVSRDRTPGNIDIGTAAATCNGSSSAPAGAYFATAEPISPAVGLRYFAVDSRGTIYESRGPIGNPIMNLPGISVVR